MGLDFFEKKRSRGLPPGLAPAFEPLRDDDFPEVEIIVGDPSKFEKSPRPTEIQPVDDTESEETSQSSTTKPNESDKVAPPSTVLEPEEDEDVYRPTVRSWGMFPRPQNISKAVRYSCNISMLYLYLSFTFISNTKKKYLAFHDILLSPLSFWFQLADIDIRHVCKLLPFYDICH